MRDCFVALLRSCYDFEWPALLAGTLIKSMHPGELFIGPTLAVSGAPSRGTVSFRAFGSSQILIDYGADVNGIMRTGRGQLITPLDAALRRGNRGCAKFLQLHGGLAAAKLTDSRALQRALSQ